MKHALDIFRGKETLNLYFYPNLSDTGPYRSTLNLGLVTKINKWLGWQSPFADIYVSNPPTGKKDLLLSTGLNFSFTRWEHRANGQPTIGGSAHEEVPR
jgi:hypothetical protein